MDEEDVPGVVALQRACFPEPFPTELLWREEHVLAHLVAFPAGQFVAALDGFVVGSASGLLISERRWQAHGTWEETTGGFKFSGHDPDGNTYFGADISVHPSHQGRGIGRGLYVMRFALVRALRLTRLGTACRLPGWRTWSSVHGGGSHEVYCQDVASGAVFDRTMTPLLKFGLRYVGVAHDHMEDEESGNAAAILEWTP